jgi:DNA-binding winged helix-turn-helix (wHTH) protein
MAVFRFDDFEADEAKFELRRLAEPVRVQRIVLETIFCLLRRQGCVVSRHELRQGPWRGARVSDAAVSRAMMLARRALGDDQGRLISTVHGLGYRFVGEVSKREERAVEPPPVVAAADELRSLELAGRDSELTTLRRYLERAREGHGRLVLLTGESGVGKTALVTSFARELTLKGPLVAWGRAWDATAAPAYWPWLEVVRSALHEIERGGGAELPLAERDERARLLASLERAEAAGAARGRSGEQLVVFDAVTRFLKQIARSRALVVILEDIQQADSASILLLEFLRQRIGELPLLVIATRRPLYTEPTISPLHEAGAHVTQLRLSGLATPAVGQLLEALDCSRALPLAGVVCEVTGGNPLLIRELALSPALAAGRADWFDEWTLPARILHAVRSRLLGLPSATQLALGLAALSGARFHAAMIGELTDAGNAAAGLTALEPALARQLVQTDTEHPGQYRLTCGLLGAIIRRDLALADRVRLQRRVREWQERAMKQATLESATNKRQSSPFGAAAPREAQGA